MPAPAMEEEEEEEDGGVGLSFAADAVDSEDGHTSTIKVRGDAGSRRVLHGILTMVENLINYLLRGTTRYWAFFPCDC